MPSLNAPSPNSHNPSIHQPSPSTERRFRMPSLFNTIRACIYGAVLLFTVICIAMAGHFQHVLAASDLTRFVPFAIFVCTASLIIFIILLASSYFLRERNPISTRIELACLGLAGIFWLVLGVYLTTSESQSADVECFASENDVVPLDDAAASFHTDQYQAMYRVLMTFALINATLVLLACLALLFLALRRHKMGDEHMWHGPVTSCAWFNNYGNSKPAARRGGGKINPTGILPTTAPVAAPAPVTKASNHSSTPYTHAPRRHHSKGTHSSRHADRRPRHSEKPLPTPVRQDSQKSKSTTRTGTSFIGSLSSNEFDKGGMVNPNRVHRSR
ncbi:hypothetical protein AX16_003141 [Volvariella volvacea WC 439]|nr:hypothetical protein AX16_003141 [Volvariella volvacea WC 439]